MADNQEQLEVQNQSGEPEVKNFLDLSDDEIANLDESQLDSYTQDFESDEETEQYEEEEYEDTPQESTEGSTEDYFNKEQVTTEEVSTESDEASEVTTPDESVYKDVYDRLFNQPIKANGKNLKLTSVDDVIRLVQMASAI